MSFYNVIFCPVALVGQNIAFSVFSRVVQTQAIYFFNVGRERIRHTTTLKLNDEFLDSKSTEDSNSESLDVGAGSF